MTYAELLKLSEKDLRLKVPELITELLQNEDALIKFVKEMKEWERIHNPDQKDVNGKEYSEAATRGLNILNSLDTHEGIELFKKLNDETGQDLIVHTLLATIATHKIRDVGKF